MTIEIKAPDKAKHHAIMSIFLGGSIDMGEAIDWQTEINQKLGDLNIIVYNPRRDDWDSSWVQDPTEGTQFHEQVTWEMNHQEISDVCVYYFTDDSKAPVTMLELGAYSQRKDKVVVHCTPKFYRYGNIKLFCDKYGITLVSLSRQKPCVL